MELSEIGVAELESRNCFLLSETQDEFSMYALADDSKTNFDHKNEGECKNSFGAGSAKTNEYLNTFSVNNEINCAKIQTLASTTEVIGGIEDLESMEREHIMFYNRRLEAEIENDLLSEISPVNPLDCSSFSDYNEFNLCLNSILSYNGDEVIHEPLSPRAIIPTDSVIRSSGVDCSSSTKPLTNMQNTVEDQHLIPRSQNQLHNIFDIVHLGEDIDLHSYQTNAQLQPHAIRMENGIQIVAPGLGKDEICQERPVT